MPRKNISINTRAKAVLPDGSKISRKALLKKLGLNPSTPPDAWLAIIACGSNAAAINLKDARKLLNRGMISARTLDSRMLRRIRGGR